MVDSTRVALSSHGTGVLLWLILEEVQCKAGRCSYGYREGVGWFKPRLLCIAALRSPRWGAAASGMVDKKGSRAVKSQVWFHCGSHPVRGASQGRTVQELMQFPHCGGLDKAKSSMPLCLPCRCVAPGPQSIWCCGSGPNMVLACC